MIDEIGIIAATKRCMITAVSPPQSSRPIPAHRRPYSPQKLALPQQSLIRGDGLSLSIAAASILAKVTRDRLMVALDPYHLPYGFAQHKGYGTAMHLAALAKYGPTPAIATPSRRCARPSSKQW
ncbi:MAG: hypothetical protein M5U34_23080 [Chloroflexi bacterium]|nr:hypothetical protein [Chloroflexota bacterium]